MVGVVEDQVAKVIATRANPPEVVSTVVRQTVQILRSEYVGRNVPNFFAPKRNFHSCTKVVRPLASGIGQIRAMASDSTGSKPGNEANPIKKAINLKEHKFEHKVSTKF
jgi:hypothetical protein